MQTAQVIYNGKRIKMSALSRAQYSQMKSAYRGGFASNADAISVAELHALVKQFDKVYKQKNDTAMLNAYGMTVVFNNRKDISQLLSS